MLPEPTLDNQTYREILDHWKRAIPQILPSWTDLNAHDPGITLLELLSWLKEMQQYHLDQISDASRRKFLKLLGVSPEPAHPASAYVAFSNADQDIRLPAGIKFSSHRLIFETTEAHALTRARISKIFGTQGADRLDMTPLLQDQDLAWPVFGHPPKAGHGLYVGFHLPLPAHTDLSLFFELSFPGSFPKNPLGEDQSWIPLSRLSWEYLSFQGQYQPLTLRRDDTRGLTCSGRLIFQVPDRMQGDIDGVYWIRCLLKESYFDSTPYLKQVRNDMIPVISKTPWLSAEPSL
jgi:predicted phage baseplate assembly protein